MTLKRGDLVEIADLIVIPGIEGLTTKGLSTEEQIDSQIEGRIVRIVTPETLGPVGLTEVPDRIEIIERVETIATHMTLEDHTGIHVTHTDQAETETEIGLLVGPDGLTEIDGTGIETTIATEIEMSVTAAIDVIDVIDVRGMNGSLTSVPTVHFVLTRTVQKDDQDTNSFTNRLSCLLSQALRPFHGPHSCRDCFRREHGWNDAC